MRTIALGLITFGCLRVVPQFPTVVIFQLFDLLFELSFLKTMSDRLGFFLRIPDTVILSVFVIEVLGLSQFSCGIVKNAVLDRELSLAAAFAIFSAIISSCNRFDTILKVAPGRQLLICLAHRLLIISCLPVQLCEALDGNRGRILSVGASDDFRLVSN